MNVQTFTTSGSAGEEIALNEGVFGAAHNYNYLYHEPGAYAHNRFYTKRLIFDSIDWLDNFTLDGTITIDSATFPKAEVWLGTTRPSLPDTQPPPVRWLPPSSNAAPGAAFLLETLIRFS